MNRILEWEAISAREDKLGLLIFLGKAEGKYWVIEGEKFLWFPVNEGFPESDPNLRVTVYDTSGKKINSYYFKPGGDSVNLKIRITDMCKNIPFAKLSLYKLKFIFSKQLKEWDPEKELVIKDFETKLEMTWDTEVTLDDYWYRFEYFKHVVSVKKTEK